MRIVLFLVVAAAAVGAAVYSLGVANTVLPPSGVARLSGVTVANKVIVSAKIGGRIQILNVKEGDWVDVGDQIAVLESNELAAQRDAFVARIALGESKLEEQRKAVIFEREQAAAEMQRAEARLQVARSQATQAEAELAQNRSDARRAQELKRQNLAATQEAERLATQVAVAQARVTAEADLIKVAEAEVMLARVSRHKELIASDQLAQAEAELEVVRAQLRESEARLADTRINAPISGVVSVRIAQQGEVLEAGSPIVTIVDLEDIWVKAEVEESLIMRVRLQDPLQVMLPDGSRVEGRVSLVSPEAEFATRRDVDRVKRDVRTFGFRVALDNPEHRIHSGMTAYVFLPGESVGR